MESTSCLWEKFMQECSFPKSLMSIFKSGPFVKHINKKNEPVANHKVMHTHVKLRVLAESILGGSYCTRIAQNVIAYNKTP